MLGLQPLPPPSHTCACVCLGKLVMSLVREYSHAANTPTSLAVKSTYRITSCGVTSCTYIYMEIACRYVSVHLTYKLKAMYVCTCIYTVYMETTYLDVNLHLRYKLIAMYIHVNTYQQEGMLTCIRVLLWYIVVRFTCSSTCIY